MLKLTPSHIVAVGLLVLTISCSAGALLGLLFAALHVFPTSAALALFRDCATAGFATAVLTARRSRK